jgi:hypothetical protein
MNFEYEVIENFIPLSWQEDVKEMLFSPTFPWYFSSDVTLGDSARGNLNPAFSHTFCSNKIIHSGYFGAFSPMAHIGVDKARVKFTGINYCRTFLQLPLSESIRKKVDPIHIDQHGDHLVVLYYVVDSDGDTIFVDKKSRGDEKERGLEAKDYKELFRVTPKQGRAVVFNGRYYHTAEQPVKNKRCIVNLDISYEEQNT